MDDIGRIAQRFPLVARPRPACLPLAKRIQEVSELARAAAARTGADCLPLAATAHNKAALIASDCGLPGLARSLCWQQFHVHLRAQPLKADTARHALEPLVNLARLLIRSGDSQRAYHLLDALYQAVRSRTDTVIDGTPVSFQDLTASEEDHRTLCQWLWTVLLADGTRGLTSAGHWMQALAHLQQRNGIGRRLLDGRQVAVLTHCTSGDPATALTILEATTTTEPWEQPIAACLTVLCLKTSARPADTAIAGMVDHYLNLEPARELLTFRTRLGLTTIDLAGGVDHPDAARAATRLTGEALAAGDGYAARDLLAHDGCRMLLASHEQRALYAALHSSGLGRQTIPAQLLADLLSAVKISEAVTARSLAAAALAIRPA